MSVMDLLNHASKIVHEFSEITECLMMTHDPIHNYTLLTHHV